MEKSGFSRDDLSLALLEQPSPLASARAASLILSQTERARFIASQGLTAEARDAYLFAKVTLLVIDVLQAYKHTEHPELAVETPLLVLEGVLTELQKTGGSLLHQEALARTHMALVDALVLKERFTEAERHAAEAELIAHAIGILSLTTVARYQRASCALYRGNAGLANNLLRQVRGDENTSVVTANRALGALAMTLLSLGDEDALERLLLEEAPSNAAALQVMMLRDDLHSLDLSGQVNGLREFAQAWLLIARAQEKPFWQAKTLYARATPILQPILNTAQGFVRHSQRSLAAYVYLRQGAWLLARQRLPRLTDLMDCPSAEQLFGLAVMIETLCMDLPSSASELLEVIQQGEKVIADLPSQTLPQILSKLQLLTPLGLVLLTRASSNPDNAKHLGEQCILNLSGKTIEVYGRSGLRPAQTIALILRAFNRETEIPNEGGGQRASLEHCLFGKYYRRQVWFVPISALHIAWVLLCLAGVAKEAERQVLVRQCKDLKRRFGFVPKTQKLEQNTDLAMIERMISLLLHQQITPISASELLFGTKGEI